MTEETIFMTALEKVDPAERAAFLGQACGTDTKLRQRVEVLLGAHDKAGPFLNRPAIERPSDPTQAHGTTVDASDDHDDVLAILTPSDQPNSLGRIGHYEVFEVLGRGGFGIVFRAFDDVLKRVVAVKVLSPSMAATSPARKRFLREARSSAQVRHEHVVQVHAVEEQPYPFLVMEFVPGETLQRRVDRIGPLEIGDVVRIGRQIAEGLAAAHATGLIHRDIKPSNVLIEASPQERVKITDFGLARAADDASLTRSGVVAGTPMYMAPEQARGDSLDHRADLFSLGSVLYLMCTGRPPFRASTTFAVLKRVAEESPRPMGEVIPEIPNWFCRIVEKLHAKNPDERYQTAREVADVLADCERQMQTHKVLKDFTRIPEGKPPAARWSHRRIRVTGVLLAIPSLLYITLWFIPSIVLTAQNRAVIHFDVVEADALLILSRNGKEYQTQIGPGTIKLLPGTYDVELRSLSGRVVSQLSYYQRTFLTGHFVPHHSPQLNEIYIGRGDILRLTASFGDRDSTPLPVAVPPASTDAEGWIQLFNGKDLTGWKTSAQDPSAWIVKAGALHAKNSTAILTDRAFENYRIRVVAKLAKDGEATILLGVPPNQAAELYSHDEMKVRIVAKESSTRVSSERDGITCHVRANEWFTVEFLIRGGQQVEEAKLIGGPSNTSRPGQGKLSPAGRIGFQVLDFTGFECRKIEVKELSTNLISNKDGFTSLFNGNDLSGWKVYPAGRTSWKVENGVLIGSGKPSHLFSERGDFSNFHLRMETRFKRNVKAGAVGIFARVPFEDPGMMLSPHGESGLYRIPVPKLYDDKAAPPDPAPPTYREKPLVVWGLDHKGEKTNIKAFPADEWFTHELIVDGKNVTVKTESKEQSSNSFVFAGAPAGSGHLALQLFDDWTVVEFRKIEIKELPATEQLNPKVNPVSPNTIATLQQLVASTIETRNTTKTRFEAGVSSRSDLIATEIEVIEARIQLAEAQKNSGEIIKLLDELVIQRQADRNLTEELFKGGAISAEKMNKADTRLADAKVRLSKAKVPPKP